jgi:hypothetical protein
MRLTTKGEYAGDRGAGQPGTDGNRNAATEMHQNKAINDWIY